MNYSVEIVEGHIVRITGTNKKGKTSIWNIYLENIFWGGRIKFPMPVDNASKDKIIWMHDLTEEEFSQTGEYAAKGPSTGVACVYTNKKHDEMYFIMFTNRAQMYKRFIHFSHKNEKVNFTEEKISLTFDASLYSDKHYYFNVEKATLVLDKNHSVDIKVPYNKQKKYEKIENEFILDSIVSQETDINNQLLVEVIVDGEVLTYHIGRKVKKRYPKKYNFIPIASTYYGDKALAVRGNLHGNYSFVVRDKDEIEYDEEFLRFEDAKNSKKMFYIGKIKRFFRRKKINLYYEKFSMKAEEGTFEVFKKALESPNSLNYFVLDKKSPQWEELSKHENVIAKYSEQYYELIYTADCCISTEMSSHLNVLRSNNPYVRRALMDMKFVFLQHGVTYLKRQGSSSAFTKGKDGEPTYIVVDSEKEAIIVSKMLKIPKERCIIAGLPIFSTIEYEHINQDSKDIVTIMLTWKPSEEYLINHFEDSSYYKNIRQIYELLKSKIDKSNIRIVSHPKVFDALMNTDLADMIWQNPISEALKETKLLITDYSSACYNVFYQGGAVIFYQPDLEEYQQEVGQLIPNDDEYIGYRLFALDELGILLDSSITDEIGIDCLRTDEFLMRYEAINMYNDGKNVERIIEFLNEVDYI